MDSKVDKMSLQLSPRGLIEKLRPFIKISSSSSLNLFGDRLVTVSLCAKGSALFLVIFLSIGAFHVNSTARPLDRSTARPLDRSTAHTSQTDLIFGTLTNHDMITLYMVFHWMVLSILKYGRKTVSS